MRLSHLLMKLPGRGTTRRLEQVRSALSEGEFGTPHLRNEFMVLVRQVAREQECRGEPTQITVNSARPFPSGEEWRQFGVVAVRSGSGTFRLDVQPWHPGWLVGEGPVDPTVMAFRGIDAARRRDNSVAADPAIRELLDISECRSRGQLEAIREVMLGDHSCVLVLLPTGGGKSLVGVVPALASAIRGDGLWLFVMPTRALAKDQAKQITRWAAVGEIHLPLKDDLVWHGELSPDARTAFINRIRRGQQHVLFAGPEALLAPRLRTCLLEQASAGRVAGIVIDEAHLVVQWGTDFRPEYQGLAGLWRDLRDARENFRSVLLTATLTRASFQGIRKTFSDDVQVVSALHLRPEPSYWIAECQSDGERDTRLQEALRFLPRPLVAYATRRADVKRYVDLLATWGYSRVDWVSGESSQADISRVLSALQTKSVDVVVATSAFGLGIDEPEIRAVVHCCVPESADRLYQEVGRGGRDGCPSISLVLWTKDDFRLASRLSTPNVISKELGLERWRTMWRTVEVEENGQEARVSVDVEAVRVGLNMEGDENRKWNLRTLALLQRAGMLRMRQLASPQLVRGPEESEDDFEGRRERVLRRRRRRVAVEVLRDDPTSERLWARKVVPMRESIYRNAAAAFKEYRTNFYEAPAPRFCHNFVATYTIFPGAAPEFRCGGCPGCRSQSWQPVLGSHAPVCRSNLASRPRSRDTEFITYRVPFEKAAQRDFLSVCRYLVATRDVRVVRTTPADLDQLESRIKLGWEGLFRHSGRYYVAHRPIDPRGSELVGRDFESRGVRLVFLGPARNGQALPDGVAANYPPCDQYIFCPEGVTDERGDELFERATNRTALSVLARTAEAEA